MKSKKGPLLLSVSLICCFIGPGKLPWRSSEATNSESPMPYAAIQLTIAGAVQAADLASSQQVADHPKDGEPWVEQVSWKPRAFIHHNFLSEEECDGLVEAAKPLMRRSSVVSANGTAGVDEIRTSYGMFLRRMQSPLVTQVEEKVAAWTRLPVVHQEDLQVLRYGIGQKYGAHYDSLSQETARIATVLLYLRDNDLYGGETAFPMESEWIGGSEGKEDQFSDCAKGHVAAQAKKGDALMFYSLQADGEQDKHSMHTGCPVVSGVKWTGTVWIHTKPFRPEMFGLKVPESIPPSDLCEDMYDTCPSWADEGECDINEDFMKGNNVFGGHCMKSCKMCETCTEDDIECRNRNRVKTGLLPWGLE